MHLDHLLHPPHVLELRQQSCVTCTSTPTCNCAANEDCFLVTPSCTSCGSVRCVPRNTGSSQSSSKGTSKGALVGATVGILIVFAGVVALYFWYRRRRAQTADTATTEAKDIPASADAVLNRPDPSEKLSSRPPTEMFNSVKVYSSYSEGTIDLDPESQRQSSHNTQSPRASNYSNPFSDGQSIQTTGSGGTQGTNVIPIAFVAPGGSITSSQASSSLSATESHPLTPLRPARPDDSADSLGPNSRMNRDGVRVPYAPSQISGISGMSRNSYISSMSYSSEFLNEAPVIVSPTQGVVRQVIGSVKAEMVNSPGPSVPSSPSGLTTPTSGRPPTRSPLAATSFGPSDVVSENEEEQELSMRHDPFRDSANRTSSTPSASTFNTSGATPDIYLNEPAQPWGQTSQTSRPSSISTQASAMTFANISSAARVNVGLGDKSSPSSAANSQFLRSPYRTTMGRLVTPPSNAGSNTLEEQQERALVEARIPPVPSLARRVSGSSAISNTADSILESFPFVPPSPISNRPIRSPPTSPNQAQFQQNAQKQKPTAPPPRPPRPPSPKLDTPLAPPNRRTLGMSTGSQLSTASSGLESFPFQIESGVGGNAVAPSSFPGRHRASLDTLALTSALSAYPLGFDPTEQRDSFPPKHRNP